MFIALFANPSDFDLRADGGAERPYRGGDSDAVEFRAFEVPHHAAAVADEVMVVPQIGVEAHALAPRPEGRDQAEVAEQPQRSVDGIERHGGHSRLYGIQDFFGIRVLRAGRNLAEDFQALMGELYARLARLRGKRFDAPVDLFGVYSHKDSQLRTILT